MSPAVWPRLSPVLRVRAWVLDGALRRAKKRVSCLQMKTTRKMTSLRRQRSGRIGLQRSGLSFVGQGASSVLTTSSANPRRKLQRKRRRRRKRARVVVRKVSLRSRLPVLAQHGQRLVAQERRRLKWSVFSSLISVLRHTNVHSRLTLTTATIEDSLLRSLYRSTRGIVATLGTVEMPVMKFPEVEVLVYLCHLFLCYWYLVLLSSSAIRLRSSLSLIFN